MTEERLERRLAAVLAADVAGYSRLMGADEEASLARLKAVRKSLVDPAIIAHRGRIVKTTGDGMLVEFASAVDAARCAVEVQRSMAEQNTAVPQDNRIEFRIGIHVGDIIIDDNDIFGDGVNIAARLEGIAQPGGICISDDAQRQIRGKVDIAFEDMGPQNLKNITEPMRAWRTQSGGSAASKVQLSSSALQPQPLALPDKPSIAVLPFQNMSGDPEQEYFVDGMVEDIITALSRIKWLFVIARNSSFMYKGRVVDVKQIGRELGVRYVLEGSVRKAASRIRITGQLIEAATGHHIWADRWDGTLEDVFELQDRITERVVSCIEPSIQSREIARIRSKPTDSLEAYDLYLRALPEFYSFSAPGYHAAEVSLRRAITLDPNYSDGWAALADCLGRLHVGGWAGDARQSVAAIEKATTCAVRAGSDNASALAIAAWANAIILGKRDEAVEYARRAIELHPNSAYVRSHCGWAFVFLGKQQNAVEQFETARRFNPIDPRSYTVFSGLAAAHFFTKRFDDAVYWASRARAQNPGYPIALRFLAASLAHMERLDEAAVIIGDLLAVQPNATLTRARESSFVTREMVDLYVSGLHKAGLPE